MIRTHKKNLDSYVKKDVLLLAITFAGMHPLPSSSWRPLAQFLFCHFSRNFSTHLQYYAVITCWHVYCSRSPDSRLLKEGLLHKVNSRGPRPYKFVLFSDALVYGTETMRAKLSRSIDSSGSEGRKYKAHRRIPCNEFLILDDVESSNAFLVIYRKCKSFMVVAESAEDKQVSENGQDTTIERPFQDIPQSFFGYSYRDWGQSCNPA